VASFSDCNFASFFFILFSTPFVSNTCQTVPNPLKQAGLMVFGSFKAFEHAQRPEIGLKSPSQTSSGVWNPNKHSMQNVFEGLEPSHNMQP